MSSNSISNELERILPQLRAYARSLAPSIDDADDLVSKTCVRILEKQEQFNPDKPLIAWAIHILKNINIDEFRKQKHVAGEMDPDMAYVSPNPGLAIDIVRLVNQLPPEQREILVLSGIGYRYKEIAEKLGIPIGTVMSRLKRGRDALYRLMDDGGSI
ncbi:MAG: RNA polymerase sigma factor [Alphaproteobacteria bacterium]|nr:RNA polymerase sigma factor [Alphaproteobacteria bacterium]